MVIYVQIPVESIKNVHNDILNHNKEVDHDISYAFQEITGTARGEVLDKLLQSRECVIQEIGSVRPILLHVLLLILWWNG